MDVEKAAPRKKDKKKIKAARIENEVAEARKAKKKQLKAPKQANAEEELEAAPAEESIAEIAAAEEPVVLTSHMAKSVSRKKARANKNSPAKAIEADIEAQGAEDAAPAKGKKAKALKQQAPEEAAEEEKLPEPAKAVKKAKKGTKAKPAVDQPTEDQEPGQLQSPAEPEGQPTAEKQIELEETAAAEDIKPAQEGEQQPASPAHPRHGIPVKRSKKGKKAKQATDLATTETADAEDQPASHYPEDEAAAPAKREKKGKKSKKASAAVEPELDIDDAEKIAEAENKHQVEEDAEPGGLAGEGMETEEAKPEGGGSEPEPPLTDSPAEPAKKGKKAKKQKEQAENEHQVEEGAETGGVAGEGMETEEAEHEEGGTEPEPLSPDSPAKPAKKAKKAKKQKEQAEGTDEPSRKRKIGELVAAGEESKKPKKSKRQAAKAVPVAAVLTNAAGEGATAGRMELELASGTGAATLISPALTRRGTAHQAFQRVKAEEWLDKSGAHDNSYKATFGSSGWGAKAQEVLGQVRGKDFRHEKTKKKRGTYRGGVIDNAVNSVKFDSDGE